MSLHSRIDKMLGELLDVSSVINYLGQNITFPRLAVAQARISGKAEGRAKGLVKGVEQGNLEMAKLVCDKLIPDLETRANESLRSLGKEFISTLGNSKIKGSLVRDMKTDLPINVHPMIKEMFLHRNNPYYFCNNLTKKTGQHGARLKNPERIWSAATDESVDPDMTQEEWEGSDRRFPRYHTGELMATCSKNKLLSKLENLPTQNILQDMRSKRSFHIHDWNRPSREFVANLRVLPPTPPPPP